MRPTPLFDEATRHLPAILSRRGMAPDLALIALESLALFIDTLDSDTYGPFEIVARNRLKGRDEDDWQVLASSIALACPIWTEDVDFFGTGAATWTTDRVELFLADLGYRASTEVGQDPS